MTGKPPTTYAEWSACLEQLALGRREDELLEQMRRGSIAWERGVAERLTARIGDYLGHELKRISDQFLREQRAGFANLESLGLFLIGAKKRLHFLWRVATLPALPHEVQEALVQAIDQFAESAEASLLQTACEDRTGELARLIKDLSMTRYREAPPPAPAGHAETSTAPQDSIPSPKRRVILP
ncbi:MULTISPECIES: hypothetical protein [Alicyclobacillus]|uniref:Uncharacterized protein n=1 Tax=Alicyclobacillus vulcanalis TaxID=252246 RepID=A0A1N7MH30_9BACL|nr:MULTISPECIES: hypothetical protein [Alicyclobacillus]SIS85259.1 hypothetical protein SAMN05421799_105136 [Alicyclobacillus vulcanalis]